MERARPGLESPGSRRLDRHAGSAARLAEDGGVDDGAMPAARRGLKDTQDKERGASPAAALNPDNGNDSDDGSDDKIE